MCGFLCNGTREYKQTDMGGKQTDAGNTSRKRQPPVLGGCLVRLVLYHRSALYNTSKEKTKNVSAPRVASGTKRTLVQVPCRSRSLVGACRLVSVKPGRGRPCLGCLTRRAAARYNRNENAVGAGGNRGGRGAKLFVYLLPVGGGGRQRTRTRGAPYGILHRGGTPPR